MSIPWLPWSGDAFAQAREASKPVLLFISATWCRWCDDMERTAYAEPAVQRLVADRFVAVRVDADKRPDIFERYALGGVPTTAFLTGDGGVFGGGTYVPVNRMAGVLEQAAGAFASRRGEIDRRARELVRTPPAPSGPEAASSADLIARVFDTYDPEYGGFGSGVKFPLTPPLRLALTLDASPSSFRDIVEQTLDAMWAGRLYDEVDGGFFRYAASRDWENASEEKLLDVNAGLLRLYVDAADVLQAPRYREIAIDILRYLQTWLSDPVDGGWAGSQHADSSYYALRTPEARSGARPPDVDRTIYTGWNAQMVSATLRAAQLLNDPELGQFAVKSMERVLLACYQPGGGVAHYHDGAPQVRGLLDDQIQMAAAVLDAFEATGNIVYSMMAEELGHYVLRTMWDEEDPGFLDRVTGVDEVGLLKDASKPFVSNCEAVSLMCRLAASSGTHEFREKAEAALTRLAGPAQSQGPLAAHYLLALRECGLR